MKDNKTIGQRKTDLEFSLKADELFEKALNDQIEINAAMAERYERELSAKDLIISNQREIIINLHEEIEKMEEKN